jgi:hypothetical protein
MILVMRALPHRLTHILRLAAIVLMAARLVIAAAPYADASRGGNAAAHVEDADARLHHAHDESDCLLCAAQQIGGTLALSVPAYGEAPRGAPLPLARGADLHRAVPTQTTFSRAPPLA